MLASLRVQNFAIIENVSIDFKSGLNVLTGETGAGKSLIIDAIGLLFGNRFQSEMIRSGEMKTIIEGIFENVSTQAIECLNDLGIELLENNIIVIKREFSPNGKNLIRINGDIVTLNQLDELAMTLGDIHTQNDTKKLFEPKNYLSFIENKDSLEELSEYNKLRFDYINLLKKYQKIIGLEQNGKNNRDFWEYQYDELEKADLKINELVDLNDELNYLNNFDNIYKLFSMVKDQLNANNINDQIYQLLQLIIKLSKYKTEYGKIVDSLNEAYYTIDDLSHQIIAEISNLEYDETRINIINERISYLNQIMRKYKKDSIKDLIELKIEFKNQLKEFEESAFLIKELENDITEKFHNLKQKAIKISNIRLQNAKILTKNIMITLKELMLENVQLEIIVTQKANDNIFDGNYFKAKGIDDVDFFVSFNIGEPLKQLSKVASGGEMSRFMLALKTHLYRNLGLSTVVFDEIDAGVSGAVASKVASKMKQISKDIQVLTITHLPIVASAGDYHYQISKYNKDNKTITHIEELDDSARIKVLATMIAPNDKTENSYQLARSMLENSR